MELLQRNKLLCFPDQILPSHICPATREGLHHDKTWVQNPWGWGGGRGSVSVSCTRENCNIPTYVCMHIHPYPPTHPYPHPHQPILTPTPTPTLTSPGLIVALDSDIQSTRNGDQLRLADTAVRRMMQDSRVNNKHNTLCKHRRNKKHHRSACMHTCSATQGGFCQYTVHLVRCPHFL